MSVEGRKMNQGSEQLPARPDLEKVEKIKQLLISSGWLDATATVQVMLSATIIRPNEFSNRKKIRNYCCWDLLACGLSPVRLGAPRKSITQTRSQLSSGLTEITKLKPQISQI